MKERVTRLAPLAAAGLCCVLSEIAGAEAPSIAKAVEALTSVHPIAEVAISPDGKRVIYGSVVTEKRGGADVASSGLWLANAHNGAGAVRLTACPSMQCDEHSAAWSPD